MPQTVFEITDIDLSVVTVLLKATAKPLHSSSCEHVKTS